MTIELSGHFGYKRIIKSAVPSIAMMAVTSAYTMIDGFFVSNFAGSTPFAALNLIWPVIAIISAIGLMFGAGGSALVSKTFGEGNGKRANRLFSMVVKVTLASTAIAGALLFIFMKPVVLALGGEGGMIDNAILYGRIITVSLPLYSTQLLFNSFYMVAERPEIGTKMSIICGLVNIGLDALFVAVFGWGIAGAAVATVVAYSIGGLYPLVWFSSSRNKTQLKLERTEIEWKAIAKSCSNGLSEYVGNIALNILGICYNLQLMKYIGEDGVSAYGIIIYLGFLFSSIFIGYNISMSQVISFNYGAGNKAELSSLLKKSLVLLGLAGLIITLVSELVSMPLSKAFVGFDKELCDLTVHSLRIYMVSFLICGYNMFVSAWFTALNNGIVSAVAAFSRTLVFELGAVFILPAIFGIDGIWNSVNVAEVLALILSASLILGYRKKYGY